MILTVTLNAAIDKRYVMNEYQMGEVNRVTRCKYSAGGKGLNVSRVATIAGEQVIATGFLGGHAGAYISEAIIKQGIVSDFVYVPGESRSCINIYDKKTKRQTELLEPGLSINEEEQELMLKHYMKLLDRCNMVTISGSVPQGVSLDCYAKMVEKAKEAGKKVLLDTSGKLLEATLNTKPTLIKPNKDEIKSLTGKTISTTKECIEVAQELYKSGIEIVVISLGSEGCVVVCSEGIYEVKVPKIETVNATGCGDAMIAGFAVGLGRGLHMEEVIRLASAISVANAKQEETGFFVESDVEMLLPQIQILNRRGDLE